MMSRAKHVSALIGGLFAMVTSMSPVRAATFVYVSSADSKDILVLNMNPQSGDLTVVENVPVTGAVAAVSEVGSMPLAISPDRRFLYAALRFTPFSAVSFGIDSGTGKLTRLASVPLPDSMAYVATDKTGRFLLSASYGGHKVAINPIGAQGAVLPETTQVVATEKNAHAVLTDPSNKFVFATNLGGDIVMQQKFDAVRGTISPNAPAAIRTKPGAGPRHFVFHPS
ncbi:MAG: beta-propeller fold lactonase family protein, partial [Proteobacteria bacterium]|nr:beta-propeller fold lactonase family protein [Pseudomonadota bacterium]